MSAPLKPKFVSVSSHARDEVESYENEQWRRQAARDADLLTPDEQADLLLEWGGYESAMSSTQSSFGAALEAARRRSPPRDRPVWRMVRDELHRRGRRMAIDDLVRILCEMESLASAYEVRKAIRGMKGAGKLVGYVQETPRVKESVDYTDGRTKRETVHVPTEMVALPEDEKGAPIERVSPQERWRREDEDLEKFCQGCVPCHETRTPRREFDADDYSIGTLTRPTRAANRLPPASRVVLERYYGRRDNVPFRDVFGDLACIVEYTAIFAEARTRVDAANKRHIRSTPSEVLSVVLGDPSRRQSFVVAAKRQARALLVEACELYRLSRICE